MSAVDCARPPEEGRSGTKAEKTARGGFAQFALVPKYYDDKIKEHDMREANSVHGETNGYKIPIEKALHR